MQWELASIASLEGPDPGLPLPARLPVRLPLVQFVLGADPQHSALSGRMIPRTHPLGPGFGNTSCPEWPQMRTLSQNELQLLPDAPPFIYQAAWNRGGMWLSSSRMNKDRLFLQALCKFLLGVVVIGQPKNDPLELFDYIRIIKHH